MAGIRESLRQLREEKRQASIRDTLAEIRSESRRPAADPTSFFEQMWIGAQQKYQDYIESPIYALAEAGQEAARGNFTPLKQIGERAGRGALKTLSLLDPRGPGQGAINYMVQSAIQDPEIERIKREQEKRRASNFAFVNQMIERSRLNERAALDPSISGRVARFIGGAPVAAAPAVVAGVASGGSIPVVAGVTALQSAAEPETATMNVALASLPAPAIAPILRRIRGARGVVTAAEEAAPGVVQPGRGVVTGPAAEEAAIRARAGLPPREPAPDFPALDYELDVAPQSFSVRAAPDLPYKETVGPSLQEAAMSVGGKSARANLDLNPQLATSAERSSLLEVIGALRKAGMLTGLKTHLKNVGGTGLFQLSEELARVPAAVADLAISAATKRRTISGPSVTAFARSSYEAATKGLREAGEIIRRGLTDADMARLEIPKEIASGSKILDGYINGVFRLLNAEDRIFRTFALRRALEDRARAAVLTEIRAGVIPRGEYGQRLRDLIARPTEEIAAGAAADAEVAVFTNQNAVSEFLAGGRRAVESLPGGKGGLFLADQIFPFVKTPTNVIARMLEYTPAGFVKNATQAARAIANKAFTAAEQRAFSQTFGRASIGSAIIALGAKLYASGQMTGLIEDDPGRRARDEAAGRLPGSIKVGNKWVQLLGFAPLGNLLAIGATLQREVDQEKEAGAGLGAVAEVGAQAIGEQPLLIGVRQIADALKEPGSTSARLLGGIAGSYVPTAISDIGTLTDTTAREAKTLPARVAARIPGLRNTLPERLDVLGHPISSSRTYAVDPTRTTAGEQFSNPLFAELVRLDQGISGFRPEPGETPEAYRARVQDFGRLFAEYGAQLITSNQYRSAADAERREVLQLLNARAKSAVTDEDPRRFLAALRPGPLFTAVKLARQRKQEKERRRR